MLHIYGELPKFGYVACSGGADSMALLSFLSLGKKEVELLYFNHGTEFGNLSEEFLLKYSEDMKLKIHIGRISRERDKKESPEEFWRNERYKFFNKFDAPIMMAHHLDDAVETWIHSCLNGNPRLIPYRNGNVIRPFLLNEKEKLLSWCKRKGVPWVEDPSNMDVRFTRNRIRHNLLAEAYKVQPGLRKIIMKKYLEIKPG